MVQVNENGSAWKRPVSQRVQNQNLQGELRLCRNKSESQVETNLITLQSHTLLKFNGELC